MERGGERWREVERVGEMNGLTVESIMTSLTDLTWRREDEHIKGKGVCCDVHDWRAVGGTSGERGCYMCSGRECECI